MLMHALAHLTILRKIKVRSATHMCIILYGQTADDYNIMAIRKLNNIYPLWSIKVIKVIK